MWAYRDRWAMGYVFTPLLVSRGYAVLHPNPRGSSGRGQDFARAVLGDMGGADTYDYLSGIDALVERGIADPARIGVAGGSYGGFMSAWLITQDQRFAAAVPMAPSTNWYSQHHTSNIPFFDTLFLADEPRARTGKFLDRSPLLFADQVATPTLQTTGALDRCTPPGQAVEFHNALREVRGRVGPGDLPGRGPRRPQLPGADRPVRPHRGLVRAAHAGLTGSVMAARVVIVGAGAVGLCCAYFLQRAGFEVTVLDAGPVGDGSVVGQRRLGLAVTVGADSRPGRAAYRARLDRQARQPAVAAAAARPELRAVGPELPAALHQGQQRTRAGGHGAAVAGRVPVLRPDARRRRGGEPGTPRAAVHRALGGRA